MVEPSFITGGTHRDFRGVLSFVNAFDMDEVRRFYTIEHVDVEVERGWRAHKIEQRWFSICAGSFVVKLVKIDDWENPNPNLPQMEYVLNEKQHGVLHIPKGYASLVKANEANSKMIVFADSTAEEAKLDDHLFPSDYFIR